MRLKKTFTPSIEPRQFSLDRRLAKITFAIFLGAVSGYICNLASLPLPWMLGAMFVNIIAALIRLPIAGPTKLRPIVAVVIGVMLGSSFTPTIFDQISLWAPSLIFMALYLLVAALVIIPYYRRVAGFDAPTA